jgi:hypothetical protein
MHALAKITARPGWLASPLLIIGRDGTLGLIVALIGTRYLQE